MKKESRLQIGYLSLQAAASACPREAYKTLACRNLCTVTLLLLCPDTGAAVRILGNIGALLKY